MKIRYDDIDVFLCDDFNDLSVQSKKVPDSLNNNLLDDDKTDKGNHSITEQKPKTSDLEPKSYQFYKIYSGFMSEYGSDVAIIAAIFATKQRYLEDIKKINKGDFFFLEHPKIEKMTHISTHYQKIAIKKLVELKILRISPKKKGTPPKTHYRVNIAYYEEFQQIIYNKLRS